MYLSQYILRQQDIRALRLTDTYSLHRAVYDLFDDVRGKNTQEHSGILYADKGGTARERRLLILSNRLPLDAQAGTLQTKEIPEAFLQKKAYQFEIIINPVRRESATKKLRPLRTREEISAWFCTKAPLWGFQVREQNLLIADIHVDTFQKKNNQVTLSKAHITGLLDVTDTKLFITKLCEGLGRGRAFGCGLLQLAPAQ